MKRTIFFAWIILFTIEGFSQRFDGGATGGLSLSQIDGDWQSGYHNLGLNAGLFVRTDLTNLLAGQLELKYNKKGAAKWGRGSSYIKSLHYIDLPIMVQLSLTEKIVPEIGLSAGYLVGAKFIDEYGISPYNPKNTYSRWDFNFLIGVNYYFKKNFAANARWGYSLFPLLEYNTGIIRSQLSELLFKDGDYNNYLNFSIYYIFK